MTTLVERARQHRSSGAVLKTRLSHLRSRYPHAPICIFEGEEDVGPYRVWLYRVRSDLNYEPLPGSGKGQLLDLRRRLKADTTGLSKSVFLFVDRDFDDLRGQSPGNDIYCTSTYSFENELVTESVVVNILSDEFQCTGENDDRTKVLKLYHKCLDEFISSMRDVNQRMFRGKALGIRGDGVREELRSYVHISFNEVRKTFDDDDLKKLVHLHREPTSDECARVDPLFLALGDPAARHRGKFLLAFLLRWTAALAMEKRRPGQKVFSETKDIHFTPDRLSPVSLAARSHVPAGLTEFAGGIS